MMEQTGIEEVLQRAIAQSPDHCLTFAEFMGLVLYHPQYGYYSQQDLSIGKSGDFYTSSSLGSDFGELIAVQILEMAAILGESAFTVVEMGAGTGDLAVDLLNNLCDRPDLPSQFRYVIIEQSPCLRQEQQHRLQPLIDQGINIIWQTWTEIQQKPMIGCFFSNELVDAFPVHRLILNDGKLQEIYVRYEGRQWIETVGDRSTPKLHAYFERLSLDLARGDYPEGYCTEVNLKALDWLENVAQSLERGYVLTLDYGYPAAKYYHPQRDRGTLQCYFQHRRHHNPYLNLGQQDITTHVDFTTLQIYGKEIGLDTLGFTQQGLFLMALGLGDRLTTLSTGGYALPEILQRRDALHQLIDPTGLGGFGVLLQGKGLTDDEKRRSLQGLRSGLS
jgi:SAM-dependent MidA family methyltransferase